MTRHLKDLSVALENVANRLESEREYLVDLDSEIGDADHGTNVYRGFARASEQFDPDEFEGMAEAIEDVGMNIVSEVGGASGALYGGSLMAASEELEGGLTAKTAVAFAEHYLSELENRGGASVGQKTMVDAMTPAVHTLKRSIEVDEVSPSEALERAVTACEAGVEYTTHIRATEGRASYLDWRSVGHQDPGATSTLFILEELLRTAQKCGTEEGQ